MVGQNQSRSIVVSDILCDVENVTPSKTMEYLTIYVMIKTVKQKKS